MRITSLEIDNFRGISRVALSALPGAVVLAGPNGCGKSSVLDALRLLKSAYGQYHENEYQSWFSEFQINIQQMSREAHRVLQDPRRPLIIAADLELSPAERAFLETEGPELVEQLAWARAKPANPARPGKQIVTPVDRRVFGQPVQLAAQLMRADLTKQLALPVMRAAVKMDVSGAVNIEESTVLELIFSTYAPKHLGVIDYHGANRTYGREQVASVSLNVAPSDDRFRQSALYNTQNKYTNVKTEMAAAFVQELLMREAGVQVPRRSNIIETLQELFEVFFPGKRFLGPQPTSDGRLLFPVELENGLRHDIDELSSGEKEVLLGYLRLRSSAPSNSVILLDEPELHLNPRLIRGLPRFYQKHLGEALNNQIWMITHSDTLLREAVEEPAFAVYHMQPSTAITPDNNQAHLISIAHEVERAVVELVGDLATYSPRARIVLLEGGGNAEVDLNILRQLFPEFAERVNIVSAGSKRRVREVHDLLERAARDGRFRARFFSIVDRDFDGPAPGTAENRYAWSAYHIENYLIHPAYIRSVLEGLEIGQAPPTEQSIEADLLEAARDTIPGLVRERLEHRVNQELVRSIRTNVDRAVDDVPSALHSVAEECAARVRSALDTTVSVNALARQQEELRSTFENALRDGSWRTELRGRDILHRFVNRANVGIRYERFRNLLINRMRLDGYKPEGMRPVVDAILAS